MAKDNRKKKKSCVPLDGYQAEQLAKLIIPQTEGERWFYSVNVDSIGAFYRFFCYTGHKHIFL